MLSLPRSKKNLSSHQSMTLTFVRASGVVAGVTGGWALGDSNPSRRTVAILILIVSGLAWAVEAVGLAVELREQDLRNEIYDLDRKLQQTRLDLEMLASNVDVITAQTETPADADLRRWRTALKLTVDEVETLKVGETVRLIERYY